MQNTKTKTSSVLKFPCRPRKYVRIAQHLGIQSKRYISAKDNNISNAISVLNKNIFVRDCSNIAPNKNIEILAKEFAGSFKHLQLLSYALQPDEEEIFTMQTMKSPFPS